MELNDSGSDDYKVHTSYCTERHVYAEINHAHRDSGIVPTIYEVLMDFCL